jgi:probable DNA metabolism protein
MKIFLTDKNIDGILSALFLCFTEKILPDDIEEKTIYQPKIDAITIDVKTNAEHSSRVKKALFEYGGSDIIALMRICLKSCDSRSAITAFNYGYLTLVEKTDISERMEYKLVSDFSYMVQKVLHERHVISGLLRFKESMNGVLYSQYSPDNDITDLLAPHFLRRLGTLPFIIHDVKRGVVSISDGHTIKTTKTDLPPHFTPSEKENYTCELWRRYYKEININERKNLRLQDRFIPRRYRAYTFETWE